MLAAILLLAFAIRLYRLGSESLWYDETVSVHLASKSFVGLVAHTAGDIHPPGYYLLLHAWTRLAGSSDFAAAFLSLFFGMLLVALAYWLAARVSGPRAGLFAAFLVAISPYNLWYSQEVRMYTLGAVLSVGVLAAVLHLMSMPAAPKSTYLRWLAVYGICGALGLWSLYYFAFLLVAVNLLVVLWWLIGRWAKGGSLGWLGRWLLAQVGVILLYAAWLPTAWRQATEPPVPPWRGLVALGDVLVETWSALSLGQSAVPGQPWPVLLLFGLLFILGLVCRPATTRPARSRKMLGVAEAWQARWFLAGSLLLPVLFIYLASFVTPLFHVRYVFTYSTAFYVICGAGLAWIYRRWRMAGWLVLVVVTMFSGVSIHAYHTDPRYASDDQRGAVRFLSEQWRPGDAILVNAGYAYTALETYWEGVPIAWRGRLVGDGVAPWEGMSVRGPVVVQTGSVDGAASLGWGDLESDFYAMSRAETSDALERLFADFDRVWVYRIYDTVTDGDGFIRGWLDSHGTKFQDLVFTGESNLRVQGFVTDHDPLLGTESRERDSLVDGSLGLVADLKPPSAVEVGGLLDLALVWEVGAQPADGIILFAGLFDATGRRWAQTDERPMGPLYPTQAWTVGSRVRTPLRLRVPPGTPPGTYRLEVGWYSFVDGQPAWLPWTSGDLLTLGEIQVVAPEDWQTVANPVADHSVGVNIGDDVRLLGFSAPALISRPSGTLHLEVLWLALEDGPEAAAPVFQVRDQAGQVLSEVSSAPVEGRAPLSRMETGQVVRDPVSLQLPGAISPGMYDLVAGRRRSDGTWLAVRRGPFSLGSAYSMATIRIVEQGAP